MVDNRGKGAEADGVQIIRSGQRRDVKRIMKAMIKRSSALESSIGHMKGDGRLVRNPLKGTLGDALYVVGSGHSIRLQLSLLRLFAVYLRFVVVAWIVRFVGGRAPHSAFVSV